MLKKHAEKLMIIALKPINEADVGFVLKSLILCRHRDEVVLYKCASGLKPPLLSMGNFIVPRSKKWLFLNEVWHENRQI